jgi:hypothetical protein
MHHTYCDRATELQKVQNLGITEASVTGQSHSKIRTRRRTVVGGVV